MMENYKDETGNVYGRLTVLFKAENRPGYNNTKRGHAAWVCRCSCGRKCVYTGASLRKGRATMCKICKNGELYDRP